MDVSLIKNQLDFNLKYARKLVDDLSEEQMTLYPALGLENHPAFTLGHLVVAAALTIKYLGGDYNVPDGWNQLFRRNGPGDPRFPLRNVLYPSQKELLNNLERQHERLKTLLDTCDLEKLRSKKKWRFSEHLPSGMDCITFMCITHASMHLGQLAAWRRALSLPSALGAL